MTGDNNIDSSVAFEAIFQGRRVCVCVCLCEFLCVLSTSYAPLLLILCASMSVTLSRFILNSGIKPFSFIKTFLTHSAGHRRNNNSQKI